MHTITTITVPFFALILFGYVAAKRRWVPPEAVPAFNGFLLYFAVPAMLFRFASMTPFQQITNGAFFMAYAVAGLFTVGVVVLIAWRLLHTRLRDAAFYGLAAGVPNAGYLGMPLIVALLGERAAAPAILTIVSDQAIVGTMALVVAQMAIAGRRGWRTGLREAVPRALLNPFLISMFLGAAFSAFNWTLPTPGDEIVRLLANAAGPCALFAIGVSLVRPDAPLRSGIVALPVAAKLLWHPLVVWLAMLLFGIESFGATVAVLVAALPTAGWVFIFAQRYEADAGRISAAILLSTALAFVTFSVLVWVLGIGTPAG